MPYLISTVVVYGTVEIFILKHIMIIQANGTRNHYDSKEVLNRYRMWSPHCIL